MMMTCVARPGRTRRGFQLEAMRRLAAEIDAGEIFREPLCDGWVYGRPPVLADQPLRLQVGGARIEQPPIRSNTLRKSAAVCLDSYVLRREWQSAQLSIALFRSSGPGTLVIHSEFVS